MQGPEIWLKQLGISVACVVDPNQPAILDVACRVFVNYEAYYLSSAEATGKFNQAPWRYTGLVTDPVTHQRFQPTSKSPSRTYEGGAGLRLAKKSNRVRFSRQNVLD